MVTLGFLNLFHGVPYMIMMGTYCRRRWAHLEPVSCGDALTRWLTRHWCAITQHTPAHTSAHQHTGGKAIRGLPPVRVLDSLHCCPLGRASYYP